MYIFTKKKSEKKIQNRKSVPKESILGKKESVSSPHKLAQHDHVPLPEDPREAQTEVNPSLELPTLRQM